jgi:hypothetical protein
VHSHRYLEALEAYETELKGATRFVEDLTASRARMLLCLGRLEESLAGFLEANDLEAQRWRGANQPHWRAIGAIQWMLGRKADAIATVRRAVDGIADGTISYADTSGGARDGLLLWYFGVSADDDAVRRHALAFLRSLDPAVLDEIWPGPVALCVLDRLKFGQLPRYLARELKPAIDEAAASMTRRRVNCHTLFYGAVRSRAGDDETSCISMMRQCFNLENPIDEEEWYLARYEVGRV